MHLYTYTYILHIPKYVKHAYIKYSKENINFFLNFCHNKTTNLVRL